jgi:hypothetical protein
MDRFGNPAWSILLKPENKGRLAITMTATG